MNAVGDAGSSEGECTYICFYMYIMLYYIVHILWIYRILCMHTREKCLCQEY